MPSADATTADTGPPVGPVSVFERAFRGAVENHGAGENTAGDRDDPIRTRILDAAYEQFCSMGIQRSSMEEVARRAGLSRITLYRRFDTKDDLVEQVILREFRRYFDRFLIEVGRGRTFAERIEIGFVSSLRTVSRHPLIGRLIETEPDMLSSVVDDGRTLATVARLLAAQLRREQRSGHIADGVDVEIVGEMMVRISASFLLIPSRRVDIDSDEQLASIARQFLVPMVRASPT